MSITIGLPFYNAEKYLLQSIQSVFAQTYTDWELILIDDGSTDNSLRIAKSISDPRVRVISDGKNKKLATRLNEIVKLAKYDIIARMDADDLMSPSRLEKQIKILEKYPEIDLVTTGLFSVSNNLDPIGVRWHKSEKITFDEVLQKKGCGIVHAAILGKKQWFIQNPYDEKLKIAQDFELWVRAYSNNDLNIFLIKEALYYYREESSATARKMLLAYAYERKVFAQYAKRNKFFLITKSFIKSFIVFVLSKLGLMKLLLNKRSTSIEDKLLLNQFNKEINLILNTKIPLNNEI